MARTVQQLFDLIISHKNSTAELDDLTDPAQSSTWKDFADVLNSNSLVSIWRKWVFIVAVVIHEIEVMLDEFKAEIQEINRLNQIGTPDWYVQRAYEFQLGDDLEVIDSIPQYAVIDPVKQIVKRAAYERVGPTQTILKVATVDGGGAIIGLNATEFSAFSDYVSNLMFAGSDIQIQSNDTDFIKIIATIYYNPLFNEANVKAAVIQAINNYLANLPFNGSVLENAIIDAVQTVDGVEDIEITTLEVRENGTPTFTAMGRKYNPVAGYIEVDPAFDLDTNLTMQAE